MADKSNKSPTNPPTSEGEKGSDEAGSSEGGAKPNTGQKGVSSHLVIDPKTRKFAKGNQGWRVREEKRKERAARPATVDSLRQDLLDYWKSTDPRKLLARLESKSPVDLAKLVVSLVPKKDDTIITRVINMSFDTVTAHEDPPIDDTDATDETSNAT